MSRPTILACALLCALGAPLLAYAQAPSAVTGLQAVAQEDGSVMVQWSPATGEVAAYRVYYSQKSILENDGYYDDVETTSDTAAFHVLQDIPAAFRTIYISVMAVDAQGAESPYFTEEVRVERTAGTAPADVPAVTSPPAVSATDVPVAAPVPTSPVTNSLRLLSAQALSATRIALVFSAAPVIDPARAPSAFSIIDTQGMTLPIEQLTIEGKNVTVQTVRQAANMVYQMRLTEPLAGEGGLPLDPIDRTAFFTGHATGISTEEAAARAQALSQTADTQQQQGTGLPGMIQPQAGGLPDVVNFRLNATPQQNQLFTVVGQWEYDPTTPEGAFIVVRQSRDGGKTFSTPEFLPGNLDGVRIPNVTPQNFGLMVYVANAEGHSSPGVFRSIFGWNTPQLAPPAASVTPPSATTSSAASSATVVTAPATPKAKSLSQTGAGAMLGLAALGAVIGWRKSRRLR